MTRSPLIRLDTVVLILLAISAWVSNPDEAHFRRRAERQLASGDGSLLEQVAKQATAKIVVATLDVDRTNYGFFSIVRLGPPSGSPPIVGVFGMWLTAPVADRATRGDGT